MTYLLGCQDRHLSDNRPYLADRLLNLCSRIVKSVHFSLTSYSRSSVSQYSPTIHSAPLYTLPDLISPNVEMSLSVISPRNLGNFSTTSLQTVGYQQCPGLESEFTYLTNAMTSTALGLLLSPKKSIKTCTTLAATSLNLIAHE